MSRRYDPRAVEAKWQDRWERQRAAEVDLGQAAGKLYLLTAPAVPGDRRLDVSPARGYVLGDVLYRYWRMNGRRVFHPLGWDAFGAAEGAAGTAADLKAMRGELRRWGILYDGSKEVVSSAPEQYRWSQWLFLRLLEKGLAYREEGRWFLRVTAYADRLRAGLDALPGWPAGVKATQRDWIDGAKLRDWRVSRRRSWGTPIPVVHCGACGVVPVPDERLPVELPAPGEGVRAAAVPCPRCGAAARRETDTLDSAFDVSWHFLRHLAPRDAARLVNPELAARWTPVDCYVAGGGARHLLPLLHTRFVGRVLHDLGLLPAAEPFAGLWRPGRIARGAAAAPDPLAGLGADAARVHLLSLGPPERGAEWSDEAAAGARRLLRRLWRLGERLAEAPPTAPADAALERERHAAIERVTRSLERGRCHTAVAALMALVNQLSRAVDGKTASRLRSEEAFDTLLQLLHPLAPHVTEELWERRDHVETLLDTSWPEYDEARLRRARVQLVVQVDGKLRDRVEVAAGASEREARAAALASPRAQEHLTGRELAKAVLVPDRLINLVTRRSA